VIHRRPFPVAALLALAALGGDSLPKPPPEPKEPRPHDPNEAYAEDIPRWSEREQPAVHLHPRKVEALRAGCTHTYDQLSRCCIECGVAMSLVVDVASDKYLGSPGTVRYGLAQAAAQTFPSVAAEAARQEEKLARRKFLASLLARDHVATVLECERLLVVVEDDQALAIHALDLAAATKMDVIAAARRILGERHDAQVSAREAWFREQERREPITLSQQGMLRGIELTGKPAVVPVCTSPVLTAEDLRRQALRTKRRDARRGTVTFTTSDNPTVRLAAMAQLALEQPPQKPEADRKREHRRAKASRKARRGW
jgi:hypothetical protein